MKAWRSGRELSQSQVAELLGISQAGYSKLEAGGVDTSLSTVAKAAEVTGLSPGVLLGEARPEGGTITLDQALRALYLAGHRVTLEPLGGISPET
ncbi:MAG TPA: helix-turn-helix transcriptional regulator [Fibrobacteria bacterium]|nr:helix-turn-helix transcriptional regulator [Geothrix sp.]HLP41235.1 helix-turn-helix transcriptional regulator [Fibrobacteria bacterium]